MTSISPELEIVDSTTRSLRYLEHSWPNDLCRWHTHEEYELHLIVETSGKALIGDYIGQFHPGSLYLTGPNLPHNWVSDERLSAPTPIRDMLVQFNQKSIDQCCQAFPELREITPLLEMARSGVEFKNFSPKLARDFLQRIRDTQGYEQIIIFLELLKVLHNHRDKVALSVIQIAQKSTSKHHEKIGEIVDYIVQSFQENISLSDAAGMAGMSETNFSRNFLSSTGNSFVEFLNRVRIGQACALLYSTDQQIASICFEVGFQNVANFNRHFLKMKNMTPSQYRSTGQISLHKEQNVEMRTYQ